MTLAHQLRDLPGFAWKPGMLGVPAPDSGYTGWCRILTVGDDGAVYSWTSEDGMILTAEDGPFDQWADVVPDLTDATTGGILWVMAGRPDVVVDEYGVYAPSDEAYPTLGEACAALMVARGRCG